MLVDSSEFKGEISEFILLDYLALIVCMFNLVR